MNKKDRWMGSRVLLCLLICIPLSASAGELGDRFQDYQKALESDDRGRIVEAAEAVYRVAEKLPEANKNFAAAALNYGKALIATNDWRRAGVYLKKSLASYEKIYGDRSTQSIDVLLELARARAGDVGHSQRWRYRRYIGDALEIAAEREGEDSALHSIVSLEAGKIALDSAADPRAKEYLQDAYTAFSGPWKNSQLNHFYSAFYLGKYYLARNRYDEAEPMLLEALDLAEVKGSKASPLELTTRAFLVEVYEEMEQPEKSIAQCRAIGKARPFDMNREPEPIFSRRLEYPRMALDSHREGYAVARFTISDTGFAEDIEILDTEGSSGFGRAAIKYLEQARYAPRYVGGEPVGTPDRKMKFQFNMAE